MTSDKINFMRRESIIYNGFTTNAPTNKKINRGTNKYNKIIIQ